jgi:pyruvate kinase
VETKIISVSGTKIEVEVTAGGVITSHKGLNVPDSEMPVRALTDKDKQDAKFGVEQGVDFIALSFVQDAKDVTDLRGLLHDYEKQLKIKSEQPIRIIAKIERHQAVKNIKEILAVVDGIMVARGDLGIEIEAADVPLVQKRLIDLAREAGKPVIVATQMLDSMQDSPRPTRAEVSDVANAVIDHTDAVMLSNETATGKYPVETVAMMTEIIHETEASRYDDLPMELPRGGHEAVGEVVSKISRLIADQVKAKVILSASISGETGRLLSSYRPELPVVVATSSERVRHQLNLSWGVVSFILLPCKTIEELIERSFSYLLKQNIVKPGDEVVVVAGEPVGEAGHVNLIEVREVR